jgi:hypothetical protein
MQRRDGYPVVIVPGVAYFTKLTWRLRRRLPMWVIYRRPTPEYGLVWVARMHIALPAPRITRFVMTHDSLAELRGMLTPVGLTRLERASEDLPEIIETWR